MGNTRVIITGKTNGMPTLDELQLNELVRYGDLLYFKFDDTEIRNSSYIGTKPTNTGETLISSDYTILSTDGTINITANENTITLPQASTVDGYVFKIKNTSNKTSIINCYTLETLNGNLTYDLIMGYELTVLSDGSNFIILSLKTN